ncbi:unnamed protein product [Prunus armeniaca]|uniref:Uncharacterized protein n=1 Tax=Prunus armeniaca TaxID=36596 RepID=A0A6J5U2T8_PRUAR|nr:unnamed protein product [Prunus armeniaca]
MRFARCPGPCCFGKRAWTLGLLAILGAGLHDYDGCLEKFGVGFWAGPFRARSRVEG